MHIHDLAYQYRESQLDLTDFWSLRASEYEAFLDNTHWFHPLTLAWLRGQNILARGER